MTFTRRFSSTVALWIALATMTNLLTWVMQSTYKEFTAMRPLRFLALGDSYTIGESVRAEARWPVQLAARLRDHGLAIEDPLIVARTGWTTADLLRGIAQADIQGRYDLVSLLIGVNNQYRGYTQFEYRQEFRALLAQAIEFAGGAPGHVIVLSIPDWGVTPFAQWSDRQSIATEIDAFNAINQEEAQAARVAYIDVTPISRQAATNLALVAEDGLHPSGAMYQAWVDLTLPVALDILEESR